MKLKADDDSSKVSGLRQLAAGLGNSVFMNVKFAKFPLENPGSIFP